MNSKFIKASLIFASMSVLLIAGCGPEGFSGSEFAAQHADNTNNGDILNDDQAAKLADADSMKAQEQVPSPQGSGGGCPTGGCPVGGAGGPAEGGGGCPTGTCEIPPDPDTNRTVQLPDQVTTEPTKIIPTGEKQMATDIVDYHTTRHIWQPSERHHTVHKHRNLLRRHFTKLVYHPTFRRINRILRTASASDQVMPTEEITEPVVDYGCPGISPEPTPVQQPIVGLRPIPVPAYPYHPQRF